MSEAENVTGVWVSLQEAASRRGVSPDTIRNWIKARKVQARKKALPQGFAYEVFLVDLESVEIIPPSPNSPPTSESPSPNALTSWEPLSVDLTPLADLVRELANRVAELERENGALTEKLSHLDRTADLAPPRPWWQWWWRNPPT
jgi:hypothetical protein